MTLHGLISSDIVIAFIPPSFIELLRASSLPWLEHILVIILTSFVTLNLRFTKTQKKICILLLVSVLVTTLFSSYFLIKKNIGGVITPDAAKGLTIEQLEEVDVRFDDQYLARRYLDLGALTDAEYDQFKKIVLFPDWVNDFLVKDAIYLNFEVIWPSASSFEFTEMDEILKTFNITKKDKILLIDYSGYQSTLISYFLNKESYNAYFANVNDINRTGFISFKESMKTNSRAPLPSVKPLGPEKMGQYYLFIFFLEEWKYAENLIECAGNAKIIDQITGINLSQLGSSVMKEKYPGMKIVNPEEVINDDKLFICLSDLHCQLTRHALNKFGNPALIIYSIE